MTGGPDDGETVATPAAVVTYPAAVYLPGATSVDPVLCAAPTRRDAVCP